MTNSRKYPFIKHGDGEAAVRDLIANGTPELASYSGLTVTTDMVGYQKGSLWVLIELEGGSYRFLHQKRSRVDITVYGPDALDGRGTAYDIASTIQASLLSWQAGYVGHGVNFQAAQIETDIFKANDKPEDVVRYVQSLRLLLLPATY